MILKTKIFFLLIYLNASFIPAIITKSNDYIKFEKNIYLQKNEIAIGDQVWMNKNLTIKSFRNGDTIKQCASNNQWNEAYKNKTPAWCYYNNDPSNEKKYGILYNWYAVSDSRGLAPTGWHIPTNEEWDKLIKNKGGYENAGLQLKENNDFNQTAANVNELSYSRILCGVRNLNGFFSYLDYSGGWWSTTKRSKDESWFIYIYHDNNLVVKAHQENGFGLSVRCIKNK